MSKRMTFGSLVFGTLVSLVLVPAAALMPTDTLPKGPSQVSLPRRPIVLIGDSYLARVTKKSGDLHTMSAIIKASGLETALNAKGPYTLFAPSDAAFAKVPKAQLEALLKDPAKLKAFVMAHVLYGSITTRDLARVDMVLDVSGTTYPVSSQGRALMVGDAKIVRPDVEAANGTLQVIDRVLVPMA